MVGKSISNFFFLSIGLVLLGLNSSCAQLSATNPTAREPTTPHLDAIFLGRCFDRNPKCDCTQLWRKFYNITAFKDATTITRDSYQSLFELSKSCWTGGFNKTLLYSGRSNLDISEELSKNCDKLCTAADILPGFALNRIQFCGSTHGQDFNYTSCPAGYFNKDENKWYNARHAFWEAAHLNFAKAATGHVKILVHAQNGVAYKRDSALARLQIPALDKTKVQGVEIFVIRNISIKPPEICGSGSIANLRDDLVKHFSESQVTCVDDPIEVRLYICEREPNSPECALSSSDKDAFDDAEFSIFEIVSAGISSFIFGTLVSLVVVIAVSRRRQEAQARKENRVASGIVPPSSSRDTSINSGDRLTDPLLLSESQFIDSDSDSDDDE
eukprot:TRINITY_DN2207_c0_g1_i2.p1 TRINITY_DN2207_c0_g1~~TRINITY_DN2207_c0_g1_i2.p1  ORF type:complete len:385 (-),score=68.18 TRINITY_DN2207_c0_g1_i2:87-1241(-)